MYSHRYTQRTFVDHGLTFVIVVLALLPLHAFGLQSQETALPTLAGTRIESRTNVYYTVEGVQLETGSRVSSFVVDQLVDLELNWLDRPDDMVVPGSEAQVLLFELANIGNGRDRVLVESVEQLEGDDFDLQDLKIYLDSNASGKLEMDEDQEYVLGVSEIELEAQCSQFVFLVGDVPEAMDDGSVSSNLIRVFSLLAEGEENKIQSVKDNLVEIVVGENGGRFETAGTLRIQFVVINISKTISVANLMGTEDLITGSIVTCYLDVSAEGSLAANDVIVEDTVPVQASYIPGTLYLDETPLSDDADADVGVVDRNQDEPLISVMLGSVEPSDGVHRISFDMMIN